MGQLYNDEVYTIPRYGYLEVSNIGKFVAIKSMKLVDGTNVTEPLGFKCEDDLNAVIANGKLEAGQKLKLPSLANKLFIYNNITVNADIVVTLSFGNGDVDNITTETVINPSDLDPIVREISLLKNVNQIIEQRIIIGNETLRKIESNTLSNANYIYGIFYDHILIQPDQFDKRYWLNEVGSVGIPTGKRLFINKIEINYDLSKLMVGPNAEIDFICKFNSPNRLNDAIKTPVDNDALYLLTQADKGLTAKESTPQIGLPQRVKGFSINNHSNFESSLIIDVGNYFTTSLNIQFETIINKLSGIPLSASNSPIFNAQDSYHNDTTGTPSSTFYKDYLNIDLSYKAKNWQDNQIQIYYNVVIYGHLIDINAPYRNG